MSAYMGRELVLFMTSVWYGSFLMIIYDCLRIMRRVIPHSVGVVAAEDLVFWIGSGLYLFSGFFRENSGILRGYLFAGTIAGAAAWHFSLSGYFVGFLSGILKKIGGIIKIPVQKIFILAKRLKFRVLRCRISLYTHRKAVCNRWRQREKSDRGAEHEKKDNRRKEKEHKRKAHQHAE